MHVSAGVRTALPAVALVMIVGCGDDDPRLSAYVVSGQVSGLVEGSAIVLRNKDADVLVVDRDGVFVFRTPLSDRSQYSVRVVFAPSRPEQTCTVTGGEGTIDDGNVGDVRVTCSTSTFLLGGTISGLASGNSIEVRNGGTVVTVDANGDFEFPTAG